MNNLGYFKLSVKNKEKLVDPDYHLVVDRCVIPLTAEEENDLTEANKKVIRYISSVETMLELKHSINDKCVEDIIKLIAEELKTKGMNYSAFCQYFNVHNVNYSVFTGLLPGDKIDFLKYIVVHYINDRHKMYESHGYSDIVLQVMSDNYSHKRKGTYGTNRIADIMKILGIPNLAKIKSPSFDLDKYYLLSDKDGKILYKKFAKKFGVGIASEGKETEKYPDALIKINSNYFIVEQKNMKEGGGGQDKQTSEITSFIEHKPEFENLHYITYIDGIYFNRIGSDSAVAKTLQQHNDVVSVLKSYRSNYFVNSYGFKKLIEDYNKQ